MLHSFDFFSNPSSIKPILKPIGFVPGVLSGRELLETFSKQTGNIAVVTDEYGGTAGIITIEDVIEEIFGDIEDEHDKEETTEIQHADGTFDFSARLEIDYLNEKYNLNFPEGEYETLSGFILANLEEIPSEGEIFVIDKFEIKILAAAEQKIEKVQLVLLD